MPTQIERGTDHAARRGWAVVATFKDDGYSAFKEITRDGFGELIAAIEAGRVVVIVRDIDRLTRHQGGSCEAVVADLDRGHADLGAAGRYAAAPLAGRCPYRG